jgi:hypothetical protein
MRRCFLMLLLAFSSSAFAYTGYLYDGECFQTLAETRRAFCAEIASTAAIVSDGSLRQSSCDGNTTYAESSPLIYIKNVTTGVTTTGVSAYWPISVTCERMDWVDGADLGWKVAAVWLAVAGLLFLARSVYGWGERNEDANS